MRLTVVLILLCVHAFGQDQWKNIYSSPAWKERDKWQRADELIRLLNIKEGSRVADIGCHEGYMTFKLSRVVGEQGSVCAVDVDQSKLDKLKRSVVDQKIGNIEVIKGDYDNPKLPAAKLDAVIILDTYHEMDDHDIILQHIKTSLKPGGRLLLCEPISEERRKLKRSEQEGKHELDIRYAVDDLEKAGFKILYSKDPFVDRTKEKGDKMWVVVGALAD
jgi:ubiquinone/menaquinone biosynthesis C-methylase UbiE